MPGAGPEHERPIPKMRCPAAAPHAQMRQKASLKRRLSYLLKGPSAYRVFFHAEKRSVSTNTPVSDRPTLTQDTGGVGSEPRVPGTSWSALTLEAGKSPTEVTRGRHVPMSPPSAISEYASPSSCSWSLNYALLETGADKVVHHQGARARRAPQSTYRPHMPPGQYVD